MSSASIAERLANGYAVTESGCWQWKRCLNSRGYGVISRNGSRQLAHRVSYETHVGPIPAGLEVDHLCRNKACVNPSHLEPVTQIENHRRRPDVAKTRCIHGHALTPENTIVKTTRRGHTMRNCRTCGNERARLRRMDRMTAQRSSIGGRSAERAAAVVENPPATTAAASTSGPRRAASGAGRDTSIPTS